MVVKPIINIASKYANNIVGLGIRKSANQICINGLKPTSILTYDTVQLSRNSHLSETFVKSLTQIKGKDGLETYTLIKDAILRKMGYSNPEAIKVEAAGLFQDLAGIGAGWHEIQAKFVIGSFGIKSSAENKISIMYHEIDHMDKFFKLYKSLGEKKFLELLSKKGPVEGINLDTYREMSKNLNISGFDANKWSKAYLDYPASTSKLYELHKYINNPLEDSAFRLQGKIQKILGESELTSIDGFPKNYKSMLEALNRQGITDIDKQDAILQEIINLCNIKHLDDKAFELYCKQIKKLELSRDEMDYIRKFQDKIISNPSLLYQKNTAAHLEAENLINQGLLNSKDIITYLEEQKTGLSLVGLADFLTGKLANLINPKFYNFIFR